MLLFFANILTKKVEGFKKVRKEAVTSEVYKRKCYQEYTFQGLVNVRGKNAPQNAKWACNAWNIGKCRGKCTAEM